jgi:Tfp pilus assembly protein PilF
LYTNVLAEFQLSYTGTSLMEQVSAKVDITEVKMAFHAALESTPGDARLVSDFAMFTWKALGDVDAAEDLYNKALELAPHDANIQASHALFLWQCDE